MKLLVPFGNITWDVLIRHQSREAKWMVIHQSLESDVCGSRFGERLGWRYKLIEHLLISGTVLSI